MRAVACRAKVAGFIPCSFLIFNFSARSGTYEVVGDQLSTCLLKSFLCWLTQIEVKVSLAVLPGGIEDLNQHGGCQECSYY